MPIIVLSLISKLILFFIPQLKKHIWKTFILTFLSSLTHTHTTLPILKTFLIYLPKVKLNKSQFRSLSITVAKEFVCQNVILFFSNFYSIHFQINTLVFLLRCLLACHIKQYNVFFSIFITVLYKLNHLHPQVRHWKELERKWLFPNCKIYWMSFVVF